MSYHGLPDSLKQTVYTRDGYRCRWCGRTNARIYDIHHIEYRRGYSYDHLGNLITLCRDHHDFVHDSYAITKDVAQHILFHLISDEGTGLTGLAILRTMKQPGYDDDTSTVTGPVGRLITLQS